MVSSAPPETTVHADLVYARTRERPLTLDLYLPQRAYAPMPLVIWVHGGAFRAGSKRDVGEALPLLREGFAIASIGYRLSQEALWPAQIMDIKAAVRWLRAHAETYRLDPHRFGAWGPSAGGHLVSMLGLTPYMLEWNTGGEYIEQAPLDLFTSVQAVCDWFGPTDFLRMNDQPGHMDHDAPDSPESQLVGAPIQQRPDLVAQANPITYVYPSAPPFLICHGDQDPLVLHSQSVMLHEALRRAFVQSELVTGVGAGHGFSGAHYQQMFELARAFFTLHLIEEPQPKGVQYVCTRETFCPSVKHPVRWLDPAADFALAQAYWQTPLSLETWQEANGPLNYRYAAAIEDGRIVSLAAAWQRFERCWELSAVSTNNADLRGRGYSKSVCSFVTQHILDHGKLATMSTGSANLAMRHTAEGIGYVRVGD